MPVQSRPVDADWTGAEIRSCCRLAALLDVPLVDAGKHVVPVARTASESVEQLRNCCCTRNSCIGFCPVNRSACGSAFLPSNRSNHRAILPLSTKVCGSSC